MKEEYVYSKQNSRQSFDQIIDNKLCNQLFKNVKNQTKSVIVI